MKKHILMTLVLVLSFGLSSQAAINPLKPGLWEIKIKMKNGGKDIAAHAQMSHTFEKMSPERREQMRAMLIKNGLSLSTKDSHLSKVCYTKEFLDQAKSLGHDPEQRCQSTVKEKTAKRLAVNFKCDDGSTGIGEWKFVSGTEYEGSLKFTGKGGKLAEMSQSGRFISTNCGNVRPFTMPQKPGATGNMSFHGSPH